MNVLEWPVLADIVAKVFWGDDRNFLGPLMRFARGDMRDHIVSHKNDHGASYWRLRNTAVAELAKINICEIFGVVRFSTLQQYRRKAETDVVHAPKRQCFGCVIRQRSRADWLDFLP
jgi:hypothetical protein